MKLLDGRVAIASHRFQSFAVQDVDVSAPILDQLVSLQAARATPSESNVILKFIKDIETYASPCKR